MKQPTINIWNLVDPRSLKDILVTRLGFPKMRFTLCGFFPRISGFQNILGIDAPSPVKSACGLFVLPLPIGIQKYVRGNTDQGRFEHNCRGGHFHSSSEDSKSVVNLSGLGDEASTMQILYTERDPIWRPRKEGSVDNGACPQSTWIFFGAAPGASLPYYFAVIGK